MKDLYKTIKSAIASFMRNETSSPGAKLNLLGGVFISLLILAIFIPDFVISICNFILSFFKRQQLPDIPSWYLLIFIPGLILYFFFCVRTITKK